MAGFILLLPATPGVRRRLASVLSLKTAGASMPLKRHSRAGYALLAVLELTEDEIRLPEYMICAKNRR